MTNASRLAVATSLGLAAWVATVVAQTCPELIGGWPYGVSHGAAMDGSNVVYGSGSALMVADVSTPQSPVAVGELVLPSEVHGVAVQGSLAYIACSRAGLRIVDVSVPATPVEIGANEAPDLAYDVDVVGTFAYLVDLLVGLRVFDVSDPSSPVEVGSYPLRYAVGLAVKGDFAYVTSIGETTSVGTLHVVRVWNPAHPAEVGACQVEGDPMDVVVEGDLAYVATNNALRIVDVSSSTHPVEIGAALGGVRGVAVQGTHAYAVGSGHAMVFDVSTPAAPQLLGWCPASGADNAIVVADANAFVGGFGLRVIDVSSPSAPVEVAALAGPGSVYAVDVQGWHAYVADSMAQAIRVVDVQDPTTAAEVGRISLADPPVAVSSLGTVAYVLTQGNRLELVDVSSPQAPVIVGSCTIRGSALAVSGGYGFVVDEWSDGFQVVDISSASDPVIVATLPVSGTDIDLEGSFAYVAAGGWLAVIDISLPTAPVVVAAGPEAAGVAVDGDVAIVTRWYGDGFGVVDVSNPFAPAEVADVAVAGYVERVAARDGYAYLLDRSLSGGVRVFDVSTPSAPVEVGAHEMWRPSDIIVAGDSVYAAHAEGGISVFRVCSVLFADGFESGDATSWSATSQE